MGFSWQEYWSGLSFLSTMDHVLSTLSHHTLTVIFVVRILNISFLSSFQIYIVIKCSHHTHYTFTCFSLSIHFHVLVIVNNAAVDMDMHIYVSSLPWNVHPDLGLLDHVVLFLYFWGTSIQIFLWQLHHFTCSPYVDPFKWSLPESRNVGSKNELAYCTLFQR